MMIKNIRYVVAFAALFALAGCAAPTDDEATVEAASADEVDADLKALLPAITNGTIDVIIVKRTASSDLAKKIIDAGGKLQLDIGKPGAPVSGELSGKFKLEDLKELLVKTDKIIVVVKGGTGSAAARELFTTVKVIGAIDGQAQSTPPADPPAPPAPAAPGTPPATPPAAPPGMGN